MNALTETQPVSAQTLEHVLGTGDLSKLSTQQRVEYYARTCQSLGLNPLTRPFRFLALNGQIQLYATRDCTDQLRKVNGITLHVVDKQIDGDLFIVTVRARTKDGREDEDIGAVTLGQLRGESRANALMKTMTKAKRRVTLSVCGLGLTDEAELDTLPGAHVFDAEDEAPVAPIRAAAAPMPRGARVAERAPAYEGTPAKPSPERTDAQWRAWLDKMRAAGDVLYRRQEFVEMANRASIGDAIANGPDWVRAEISAYLAEGYARFPTEDEPTEEELGEVEINGEDKVLAG
jgi:hypothetical protein